MAAISLFGETNMAAMTSCKIQELEARGIGLERVIKRGGVGRKKEGECSLFRDNNKIYHLQAVIKHANKFSETFKS